MKRLLPVLGLLLLAGCASNPVPVVQTQKVDMAVDVCQRPVDIPPKPDLPIAHVDTTKRDQVAKAYVESVLILEGYADRLITLLKAKPKLGDSNAGH